jgi:UDP-N-acetyl-D-glucosamine dehydrogenase
MEKNNKLKENIKSNNFAVGIIGLGYVGLPLALEFANKGIKVIGFDLDENKVEIINKQKASYIKHISSEKIHKVVTDKTFSATNDFSKLKNIDAIIICVPTPLNVNREPDLSFVINSTKIISKYLRKGQFISLESTTYPGTTDEEILSILTSSGLKVGKDFYLCFSPEREDPNNSVYSTSTIPKVIGGVTPKCTELGVMIYSKVILQVVKVSNSRAAEATKLLENIYRSINIALVNELKIVFDIMGIDIWEVINAAATKPFGFTPFYPGPGLGGHCIPIDPFYLTWKAREYEIATKFIELAGEINTSMPHYVVGKVLFALNKNFKHINGSKILILGLAYKKDIDDIRESPSLKLIELLQDQGASIDYNDEYVTVIPRLRKYKFNKKSVKINKSNLSKYDLVLLSTDHSYYDYGFILKNSKIIVDTRNAFGKFKSTKIYKA